MKRTTAQMRVLLGDRLPPVLRRTLQALHTARARHALVGAAALGVHGAPRNTTDIDLLVDPDRWQAAVRAMRAAGFRENPEGPPIGEYMARFIAPRTDGGAGADLLFGRGDPEESALETAVRHTVLGVRVRVARPEYVLWMLLASPHDRHGTDALEMIVRGLVDLPRLVTMLRIDRASEELHKLRRLVIRAVAQRRLREATARGLAGAWPANRWGR